MFAAHFLNAPRPAALAIVIAVAFSAPLPGVDRSTPAPDDITRTDRGQRFAAEAARRVEIKYGIEIDPRSLTVWAIGDRTVAGPRGGTIAMREVRREDGATGHRYEASEAPAGVANAASAVAVSADSIGGADTGWQLVGSSCWIDDHDEGSWMDVCYHKYRATTDGSSRYDYYALHMFSTFAAPGFGLEVGDPWIEARPAKGAAQAWHDWDPREDTTLPCTTTVTLEVAVHDIPLQLSASQCATWDITKYAAAGKFRNAWREGLCMMRQGETGLEFEIASRVAQGGVPTWTFHWYEEADLAACTW